MHHTFIGNIAKMARLRVAAYGAQYNATVMFFVVFFIAIPLKWQFSSNYNTTTLIILRVLSVIFILILSVWRFWPKKIQQYLPLFWLFTLFYNLPFRTTFAILHSQYSYSYATYGLLGFVALAVLVDNFLYIWLATVGIIFGAIVYFLGGGYALPLVPLSTVMQATFMIVTIAFIKLVFFRNHNLRFESKIDTYKTLASAIAHEIRGPICTINVECQRNKANPDDNEFDSIRTISRLNRKALSIIDSILLQVKFLESSKCVTCEKIDLLECINEACLDPIFSDTDRTLISVEVRDGQNIFANKELLIQVLTNLIRNSLRAINRVKHGKIVIKTHTLDTRLSLSVYDNGIGIDPVQQKCLFKPFSTSQNGVGIGLAFSKLALESIGWSISCESKKGSFTRFTLVKEEDNDTAPGLPVPHYSAISR